MKRFPGGSARLSKARHGAARRSCQNTMHAPRASFLAGYSAHYASNSQISPISGNEPLYTSVTTLSREVDLDLIKPQGDSRGTCSSKRLFFTRTTPDTFTEMLRGTLFVFAALLVLATATEVNECGDPGKKFQDVDQVKISGCNAPPCKLRRRTKASVEQKFVPDQDTDNIVNSVHAAVLGVPLPFVGVDGTSACDNIFNADGTSAGCSLKKGVEYLYKREFPILQIYPTISMVIHYALLQGNTTITCFEVPAKIIN